MVELIDAHMHVGMTLDQLIDHLDINHIGRAIVLPIESPGLRSALGHLSGRDVKPTGDVLEAVMKYPDRLIPYCHVDPRSENPLRRIEMYVEQGCRGFGEHKVLIPLDNPVMQEIYKLCGSLGIPVMLHAWHSMRNYNFICEIEEMLKAYPNTSFVVHSYGFWGGFFDPPKWLKSGGVYFGIAGRLLEEYPNFYGDLSGTSGIRTLAFDKGFSRDLLVRCRKNLIWGSDCYCKDGSDQCIAKRGLELLQTLISDVKVFEDIVHNNIVRLLKL